MTDVFSVNWRLFCAEQTPESLRIDRNCRRAWGYKRFTLANFLRFARRCKGRGTISSPFVTITPVEGGNDDSDDDLDAFCGRSSSEEYKGITPRIIKRMTNSIGRAKTDRCLRAAQAFQNIPPGKLSFRYTAPVGANGPVCLMFRVSNFPVDHESLEKLQNSEGTKNVIVYLNENTALFKSVLR